MPQLDPVNLANPVILSSCPKIPIRLMKLASAFIRFVNVYS